MSTELEPRQAVIPATGEVVSLDAPSADLARAIDEVRVLESRLRFFKSQVGDELLRRMDLNASYTLREGGYEVTGDSPAPITEWDENGLAVALEELVGEGLISQSAKEAALETVITYKPKQRGLNALLKLGGQVADRITPFRSEVERYRKIKKVEKLG